MQHFGEFFGPLMTFIVSGSLKWTIIGFSTQGGYFRALSIKIFEERCYMKLKFDAVNISDGPRQGDKRERSQKIRVVPPQVARFHIKLSVVVAPQRISQKGGEGNFLLTLFLRWGSNKGWCILWIHAFLSHRRQKKRKMGFRTLFSIVKEISIFIHAINYKKKRQN